MSRKQLIAHPETPVGFLQRLKYFHLVRRRARGVPLAYLTGHKEFFGLDFLVNKHVLVPRPETETLVELAINEVKGQLSNVNCPLVLIDIGTGSGCIPISILTRIKQSSSVRIQTMATDISKKALQVARKNAKKYHVDIALLHGDLLNPLLKTIPDSKFQIPASLIITANLPYLTAEQYAAEPSIQHEPRQALIAKNGGLALYEQLLKQIQNLLSSTFHLTAFLEIDPSQSARIIQLVQHYLPEAEVEIKKDLSGLDRVVYVRVA